jgi:hypothetical protein
MPRGASLQACRVGLRADFLKAERNLGPAGVDAGVDARASIAPETELKLALMGQEACPTSYGGGGCAAPSRCLFLVARRWARALQ